MRAPSPQPAHALRVAFAVGLSCALHAAVGVAFLRRPPSTRSSESDTSRVLTGGTFDIEAFQESAGSPEESTGPSNQALAPQASPSSAQRVPEPAVTQPAPSPPPVSAESQKGVPTADSEARIPLSDNGDASTQKAPEQQDDQEHSPGSASAKEEPLNEAQPATPPSADPFDLQLPGSTGTEAPGVSAPPSHQQKGGSYGAEGEASAVVDLHAAFLKTLPLAAKSDPSWTKLPFGPAGNIVVELTVTEALKLAPIHVLDSPTNPAPAHLKRMVQKNRDWLHTQRFSIGQQESAGTQRLRIEATITQKAPDADTPQAPGTRALGTRGGRNPTGSYFTYFSGRHVELKVTRLAQD